MSVPVDNDEQTQAEKIVQPPPRYGESLLNGRKRFAYTIEKISEELNISHDVIEKIESSSVSDLPPATFMRGYIRAYAKLVDVDAEQALSDFVAAVPYASKPLRARSNLPREANSHSPLVRITTRLLLICAVLATIYGIYTYYSEKVQSYEVASRSDQATPSADGSFKLEIRQQAVITQDEELVVETPAEDLLQTEVDDEQSVAEQVEESATPEPESEPIAPQSTGLDSFLLYADSDSWVEVTGSDNKRLHYNLLKAGDEVSLSGKAPFTVFLGNAPEMTLSINGIEVSVDNYIRSNKTAQFRVSVEEGDVVFFRR